MENILKQLKEDVEQYEKDNACEPDYVIMGWDLAYEVRRMKDIYKCTLSREYVYGIPVLETNITGVWLWEPGADIRQRAEEYNCLYA